MAIDGFLLPPWYHPLDPSNNELNLASMVWGSSVGCAVITVTKVLRHSYKSHRRQKTKRLQLWGASYVIMVWVVWVSCVVGATMDWIYLNPVIPQTPNFWVFFSLMCLWVIQTQCILQVIVNRIRFILRDERRADRVQWGVAALIAVINVIVFILWVPAQLQISPVWVRANHLFEHVEKIVFTVVDIGLNGYYIHLVHLRLVEYDLAKYNRLLFFNAAMIAVSLALDGVMIGIMTMRQNSVYFQCHPLVYLIKLHIEMNMAELIVKIRKSAQRREVNNWDNAFFPNASPHDLALQAAPVQRQRPSPFAKFHRGQDDIEMELAAIEGDAHQVPPSKRRRPSFFHLVHLGRDVDTELIDMPGVAATSKSTWTSDRATIQGRTSQEAADRDTMNAPPDARIGLSATGGVSSPCLRQMKDAHSASRGGTSVNGTEGDMEISAMDHDDSSVQRLAHDPDDIC